MTNATNRPTGGSSSQEGFPMERELIVIAKREAGLRVTREGIASVEGADVNSLADVLASESAVMRPLFGTSEEQIQARTASVAAETDADVPDLSVYYRVEAPDERLEELAARLREQDVVEAAYVKPPAELPIALDQVSEIFNDMVPSLEEAPQVTPDFTARQVYLDPAPAGIDARYAWTQSGTGAGVRIIDIEGAWRFTHEDLGQNQGGVVGGTQSTDLRWRNHGTAVVGVFGGDRNTFGCTGICPDANVRAISIFGGLGSAGAIRQAADMLNPGDIILIELHRAGPRSTGTGQKGFIAIEWWPDDFDAIRYATSRGVIVVEAAGNGAENLDDPIYNAPAPGFPSNWTNPFNRANRDSGAIVVGAGAPPPGTHGRDHGPDRSRLGFSNYGSLIDAQGWGREVTTCGYGDLQGGSNEDFWYTDQFSGTSSASPIVVGALGCLQSILRTRGINPVSPPRARNLLRSTGSPQQDAPERPRNQRIGNRPNIRQMLSALVGEVAHFGIAEAQYQTIFTQVTSSGYRPVWVDGYEVNGKTFFNAIFRPADGTAWVARHGLTGVEYQKEFDTRTKEGMRLLNLSSYLSGGSIRYATIFVKAPGAIWKAYHGLTAEQHQNQFNNSIAEGFRPVNVSVVSISGQRSYAAFYEKSDVGSFVLKSFLTPEQYQKEWNDNVAAGRQLAYLSAYQHLNEVRFSALFQQKVIGSGQTVGRHHLTSAQMQDEYDKWLGQGMLTRIIAGYQMGNQHQFAAAWRKN